MISAKEARKIADDINGKQTNKELQEIYSLIKNASGNGKYSLNINKCSKSAEIELISNGYNVKSYSQYNDFVINISW